MFDFTSGGDNMTQDWVGSVRYDFGIHSQAVLFKKLPDGRWEQVSLPYQATRGELLAFGFPSQADEPTIVKQS